MVVEHCLTAHTAAANEELRLGEGILPPSVTFRKCQARSQEADISKVKPI